MSAKYYRRKLPHFQAAQATFFITYRLAGSIPIAVIRRLKENYELLKKGVLQQSDLSTLEQKELILGAEKQFFVETDLYLDKSPNGPYWLRIVS